MPGYVLETERLRLREFVLADAPEVEKMLADDYARRVFERVVGIPDFGRIWVEKNQKRYREHGFGLWAIVTKATGNFAGDCGLTYQEVSGRTFLEIGYHLTFAARGKGYATEAAAACLRYAFDHLGASRVVSLVDCENLPSKAVAERVHARYEEGFEKFDRPIYLYSTERSDREP